MTNAEVKTAMIYLDEMDKNHTSNEYKIIKHSLEKQLSKVPNYEGDGCYNGEIVLDTWICPNCGKSYEVDYEDYEYCHMCGQHIDHSTLTEED